jgi:predicted dehydrogenase
MAHVTLYFGSGAMAHINVNWLAPVKVRQTLVGGSRRMIVYDDLQPSEKIKVYDRGVMSGSNEDEIYQMLVGYRNGDMYAPHIPATEALRTEVQHFAACVSTGTVPVTDGAMGLRIVRLLESATLSMQRRGQPVDLSEMRRAS